MSVAYDNWRFNVRVSNTEPVMRLNVETKSDKELLAAKTAELLEVIGGEEAILDASRKASLAESPRFIN